MKRGAEKQLTKDVSDDDEIEEVDSSAGFKVADSTTLAARPMRGLPKRSASSTPKPLPGTDAAQQTTPNFKGFGTASSSPFTFNMTPSASTTPVSQAGNSSFKFNSTAIAPAASIAPKQPTSPFTPSQQNGISSQNTKAVSSELDAADRKYFASLRGLNVSFINEAKKLMDADPFVDLGELLPHYKELRDGIQKEFDVAHKTKQEPTLNGSSSPSQGFTTKSTGNEAKPFGETAVTTTSSFSSPGGGFKPDLSTVSSPSPFGGGFKPTTNPVSSLPSGGGFKPNFGSASSSSPTPSPSPFSGGFKPNFGAASTPAPSASFGVSFADKPSAASSSPFSGTSNAVDSKPSPFGSASSAFKPSPFSTMSSSPFNIPSSASGSSDKPVSAFGSSTGSVFGSVPKSEPSSGLSTASTNPFGIKEDSSTTSGSTNSPFVFGSKAPGGNLGNPVGFVFGNKSSPDTEASNSNKTGQFSFSAAPSTSDTSSAPSKFTFGAGGNTAGSGVTSSESTETSRPETPASGDGSADTAGDASTPHPLGDNPHDKEGEGEEEEETVHTSRAKIYKFGKKDDQPHWAEVGVGMLRIKKNNTNSTRRLLSRNSANGKIMMNFNLYPGFKVTRTKQVLNFVGHEEGSNTTYRVRVKDEPVAIALQEAIEKELAELK